MKLHDWIHLHAECTPERLALRFPGRDLSCAALAGLVDSYAAGLAAAGVERGGCAAFLGLNSPDEVALLFACARLGAMFVPLNWRLAAPEHAQILADCPPAVLFVEPQFVPQTETIRSSLGPMLLVSLGSAPAGLARTHGVSRARRRCGHPDRLRELAAHAPAGLLHVGFDRQAQGRRA